MDRLQKTWCSKALAHRKSVLSNWTDMFAIVVRSRWVRYELIHQLGLSMEHHERISINAPPHCETWFCIKLGLVWGTHTHNESPSFRHCTQVWAFVTPVGYHWSMSLSLWCFLQSTSLDWLENLLLGPLPLPPPEMVILFDVRIQNCWEYCRSERCLPELGIEPEAHYTTAPALLPAWFFSRGLHQVVFFQFSSLISDISIPIDVILKHMLPFSRWLYSPLLVCFQ